MDEIWKDIKGFEGVYKISNFGRLASLKKGYFNILSNKNSKGDYISVILKSKNKVLHTRIHRLVYSTFVEEIPKGKKYHIHHKDGNKQNNRISNLELVNSHNHHKIHIKKNPNIIKGLVNYNKYIKTKPISQYSLDGKYIATYSNATDAYKATNVCKRNILQVANKEPFNKKGNIRKQAGGFIWKFKEEI